MSKKMRHHVVSLLKLVLWWVVIFANPVHSEDLSPIDGYFADNGFANLFNSIQIGPTGEYYNGVTYVSYQGPHEDHYVASYNHTSEEWRGPYKVQENVMGSWPEAEDSSDTDNHGAPTLVISDDGYINIFMAGHGGCREELGARNRKGEGCFSVSRRPNSLGPGVLKMTRSKEPESIEAWSENKDSGLDLFASYASSLKMDNGDIYVFYRHGTHTADWTYQKSTDGGQSFEPAVSVLKYQQTKFKTKDDKNRVFVAWYMTCFPGSSGKKKHSIGCHFTHHYHAVGPANNHGPILFDGYYLEIDTKTGDFLTASGDKLTANGAEPVTLEVANNKAMVYNSSEFNDEKQVYEKLSYRIEKGIFNAKNEPVIFFSTSTVGFFDSTNQRRFMLRYKKKDNKWKRPKSVPDKDGLVLNRLGFPFNDENDRRHPFLLATTKTDDVTSIGYMAHKERKYDWIDEQSLITTTEKVQVEGIRNGHKDARGVVAILHTKLYYKMYLIGDNGILSRTDQTQAKDLWVQCYNATKPDDCFVSKRVIDADAE